MTSEEIAIQDVLNREEQRYQAQIAQDSQALQEILDDEMLYVHSNGLTDGKKSFIALVNSIHYLKVERENVVVKIFADTAVVTGIAHVTADGGSGQLRRSNVRFVNVWVRRGTAWKNLLWQSTALPAPPQAESSGP